MASARDWFWLTRPVAPSVRAQAVQVLNAARALAARGHRVTLCVQSDRSSAEVLDHYGLEPVPTLDLRVLSPRTTLASVGYRLAFLEWVARTRGAGVALARSRRHADQAARWAPGRFRLLFEAHGAEHTWSPSGPRPELRALEARVLRRAWGLIANCPGTLDALRGAHRVLPPSRVIHNAARPFAASLARGRGVGLVGSLRAYKDPETVALAARRSGIPVTWVGPDPRELAALVAAAEGKLVAEGPLAPGRVPERLARFETLLLPLSPGPFGLELTSPLKLWDALQSGVPLVAADTPAVRRAAPGAYVPYRPGDADDLAAALARAASDHALRAAVVERARSLARTWDQRAAEVEAFADAVLG